MLGKRAGRVAMNDNQKENHRVNLSVDANLTERLRLGGLVQAGIRVMEERSEALKKALAEAETEMSRLYAGVQPSEIPGLRPARLLFRSIGVDPTRMRPASEALLRRTLNRRGIPRINSAVDAANLISLRYLIPVGLYDRDKIEGDVLLRLGRDGENFQRIGSGSLNLEGRIGLFDRKGGFGNPTGDSRRTSVTEETTSLLFVGFFPVGVDSEDIREMIGTAGRELTRHTGGRSHPLGEDGLISG
jgi:DNA/RNA-binding domain of Phe-tRNA-synthetase-like protein